MEKLILAYLNVTYPNVYTYRCKFGDILYLNNNSVFDNHLHIKRVNVVAQLVLLFSCDELDAYDVFDSWRDSRPVYVRVVNSTNDAVLVPLETVCNSTV
jgi:hypothetical protein